MIDERLDVFDESFWETEGRVCFAGLSCCEIPAKPGIHKILQNYKHYVHNSGEGCVLCESPAVTAIYRPSIQEVKERGINSFGDIDFIALHVCSNCYARMYSRSSLDLGEAIRQSLLLISRGGVKGRTSAEKIDKLGTGDIASALSAGKLVINGQEINVMDVSVTYNPYSKKLIINVTTDSI